jgi:hypothetical protein
VAKAFARGRPIASLVLSAQERVYLERQVRRHRVARSLSERCRVILRCADGLSTGPTTAEGRARISAAMRARWAARLQEPATPPCRYGCEL